MNPTNIHPDFKWEGKHLNQEEILILAEEYAVSPESYLQEIGFFFKAWFDGYNRIEVQTSGSTGKPKKLRVKKQYMYNSAKATEAFFELGPGTKALLCMPATYIAGKLMLVRALVLGWEIYVVKPQANPLKDQTRKYDFMACTPHQLSHALENISLVNKIMVGGGAVSKSLFEKIQTISSEVFETYAMTETLTHIAARKINHLKEKKVPPFKVLKDIKIEKDTDDCLVISAPKVSDEKVHTNDVVEMTDEESFYLLGRKDNIINSGGIKLFPEKIEAELSKIIFSRFFVYGATDEEFGQKLVVLIEDTFEEQKYFRLKSAIQSLSTLNTYEKPKKIYFISKFAETHSGKIKRKESFGLLSL